MIWTATSGGNVKPPPRNLDSRFSKPSVSTADITTLSCFGQQCNYLGLTYLWNDNSNNVVHGYAGGDTQLRNSQCLVDLKALSLTTNGSTLTVDLPVYGNPSFMGNRDIYLSVSNNQGQQNPGGYIKQWSNFNFNFLNNATSLATEPNFTNLSTPNFRSSAMTLYPGSSIYLMSLSAKDAFNNYCQLAYYPGGGNWVYLYSSNPSTFDNTYLPNNAYTLVTSRCTVATSTIRYDNYLPLSPPAPYVFLNAVIAPNWAMPLGWQSMVGQIHYLNGSYFVDSERLLGSWLRP